MALTAITVMLIGIAMVQVALAGSVGYSHRYCSPPTVQYGGYRPKDTYFSVGSTIRYYCDDGYELQGYDASICVYDSKGVYFSHDPPVCRPKVVRCPHLDNPRYGKVSVYGDYSHNSVATYVCDDYCQISGSATRRCHYGQWVGKAPTCNRIRCPSLDHPQYGKVVIYGEYYHDSTATYICNDHYEVIGTHTRKCQGGIWIGKAPICRPIRCPEIPHPKYGNVYVSGNYYHDSTATYKCDRYYRLEGPSTKKCLNGKWVGIAPVCQPILCPKVVHPDYGKVQITGKYYHGSVARYSCNRGYYLEGGSYRKCNIGVWGTKAPICKPIRCPDIPHPRYGKVNVSGYYHDGVATFNCGKGYEVYGPASIKCVYGRWDGKPSVCIPINYCSKLDKPEYGNVYVARNDHYGKGQLFRTMIKQIIDDEYLHKLIEKEIGDYEISSYDDLYKMLETKELVTPKGLSVIKLMIDRGDSFSVATYSCDKYYKLNGPSIRKCYYGCWDGDAPTCERITCDKLDHPKYGNVEISGNYYQDATATYTCDKYYYLYGPSTRRCHYGRWVGQEPICKPVLCPTIVKPKYGKVVISGKYYHDSTARYSCDKDYVIYGPSTRKCINGKWEGKDPICKPSRCSRLDHPVYGKVDIYGDYQHGSTATYSCNPHYLIYGTSIRNCVYGRWKGKAPICKPAPVPKCSPLPHPLYGKVVIYGDYNDGSTATYSCDSKYELYGKVTRICRKGVWEGIAPTCKLIFKRCTLLKAPNYGLVHANGNTIGAISHYKCVDGYYLVGTHARKCLANGEWNGAAPVCKPVDCGPLTKPDYGYVRYETTYYGSKAYYSCESGYTLTGGSNYRKCQANRSWTGHDPVCSHAY